MTIIDSGGQAATVQQTFEELPQAGWLVRPVGLTGFQQMKFCWKSRIKQSRSTTVRIMLEMDTGDAGTDSKRAAMGEKSVAALLTGQYGAPGHPEVTPRDKRPTADIVSLAVGATAAADFVHRRWKLNGSFLDHQRAAAP